MKDKELSGCDSSLSELEGALGPSFNRDLIAIDSSDKVSNIDIVVVAIDFLALNPDGGL